MSLYSELKRRNVLRVGAAYIVTAWLIIQVVETLFPIYEIADSAVRFVVSALAVGLVPVVLLAWAFEITPEGLKREKDVDRSRPVTPKTVKTLDRAIIVVLAVALGYFAFDKFVLSDTRETAIAESAREQGRAEAMRGAYGEYSIAVLPFADMSPGKDQEYMSDGIAEELINLLAQIKDLRVISRSSAFSFKGQNVDIPTVHEKLNANYVLEGSVRTAGDQLRITAQLIDARTDTHMWSDTYDQTLKDIFQIQDNIAEAVVSQLKVTLLGDALTVQPVDPGVYQLVLQARYFWNRRADGDEQKALEMYQQAVELAPDYAPAWAGLSVAYAVHYQKGRMEREEGLRLAHEAAEKAVSLDPNSADAHVRMGQALGRQRDWDGQRASYSRAYEIAPDSPLVLAVLARQMRRLGEFDKAIEYLERAEAMDPLGAIWPNNKGYTLTWAGKFDAAEQAYSRAYELNGNVLAYNRSMADIYILRGDFTSALEFLADVPPVSWSQIRHAVANYAVGNVEESERMLQQIQQQDSRAVPSSMAAVYAMRGDNDRAFEWLAKDETLTRASASYEPFYTNLREDPRWLPFLESLED